MSQNGFSALFYADDIAIFSVNKSLDVSIANLNDALSHLSDALYSSFLEPAPSKSHLILISRRQFPQNLPRVLIDSHSLPFSSSVTYLGLRLDPKLRWHPNFNFLVSTILRWSNFLCCVTGTVWGSHPSSLLRIFNAVIRAKTDDCNFLFSSASLIHRKKLNASLAACLRSIIGALPSTQIKCFEVKCSSPTVEIRNRWLAGKFSSNLCLFQIHQFSNCIMN